MKKHSKSQKIGTQGENAFRDFADRNRLVVTKANEDFGTDFFCVVETAPNTDGHSTITGHVVGAFVRATAGRRARIILDRSDAGHLLAARFPMCIVMVHRPRSADEQLFFRFVDQAIAVRLAQFLKTRQATLTLGYSELFEEAEFRPQIKIAMTPGFVEGVMIFLASKSLEDVLPKSRIEVHRGADGQLTIVEMDYFGEHFSISGKAHQKLLHTAVFGMRERMAERFSALPINPQVETWIKQLPQPVAFVGPITSYDTTLRVQDSTGSVSCRFEVRRSKDYFGYVHESGFAITISKAKRRGNEMVHYVNAEIDSASTSQLSAFPDLWRFLEKCMPDARITEGKLTLDVSNIAWLPQCGFVARYLRTVQDLYAWPSGTWVLADALRYETLNTLAWLCQVKEGVGWLQGSGLVVEGTPGALEEAASFLVAVCANLPRAVVLTWLKVDGHVFTHEQRIRGFRLSKVLNFTLEIRPKRLKKSDMPELVFHTGWPTIRVPEGAMGAPAPREWNCDVILL
jgi:hypothetical protein